MIPLDDFHAMFSNQALWRARKAEEYPDDHQRLAAAAELLNKLASQVELRLFNRDLLDKYSRIAEIEETSVNVVEDEQELLREVGFHFFPNTVDEFLEELIERIGRRVREEADPEARRIALQLLRTASLDEKGPVS